MQLEDLIWDVACWGRLQEGSTILLHWALKCGWITKKSVTKGLESIPENGILPKQYFLVRAGWWISEEFLW